VRRFCVSTKKADLFQDGFFDFFLHIQKKKAAMLMTLAAFQVCFVMFSASTQLYRSVIGKIPIKLIKAKIKVVAVVCHDEMIFQ